VLRTGKAVRVLASFQGVFATLLALLPGAVYVFTYERQVGSFGVNFTDRLIRFLSASAVFHALFAFAEYRAYLDLFRSGRLGRGELSSWQVETLAIGYLLVPAAAGLLVGQAWRRRPKWLTWVVAGAQPPRAWDDLFARGPEGYIRAKLKSGQWIAGYFGTAPDGRKSYAAGFPHDQDLLITRRVDIDPESGDYVTTADGNARDLDGWLLVRWEELEILEFTEVGTDESR
jgi:hypothetical protein